MGVVYNKVNEYLSKYKGGIAWRVKKHSQVVEKHLNPGEEVVFAFPGQMNDNFWNIFQTCIFCITKDRILIGQKNLLWGYSLTSITPDLYNDMEVKEGLIWGKIIVDTVKEEVCLTNLSKRALSAIETNITQTMMDAKKQYAKN